MRNRYLAIIAESAEARSRLEAQVQRRLVTMAAQLNTNCSVFTPNARDVVHFQGAQGLIVGSLFSSSRGFRSIQRLSEITGEGLLSNVWGAYVAFLPTGDPRLCRVLRDPSGALPCLMVAIKGATLVASDLDLLIASGLYTTTVDWAGLRTFLVSANFPTSQTSLSGISELLPGYEAEISAHRTRMRQAWSPWRFCNSDRDNFEDHEAGHLREVVLASVSAQLSQYGRPTLCLSGGLDSSILAACLSHGAQGWSALTMATDEPEGDEREAARDVAAHFGAELRSAVHNFADADTSRSSATHLPRPAGSLVAQSIMAIQKREAAVAHTDAFVTGVGGDNVFCLTQSATPLLDRFLAEGPSRVCTQTLADICDLSGCSVFDAVGQAFIRSLRPHATYRWRVDASLLNSDAGDKAQTLDAPPGTLPGRVAHVAGLYRAHPTLHGLAGPTDIPVLNPLLAQPIMEACLAIPTWRWIEGGQNRSVARRAFQRDLPSSNISRRIKGGPDSFCLNLIEANRATIRLRLENGVLAQNSVIDVDALRDCLASSAPIRPPHHMRLAQLLDAEAWARHQTERTS